MKVLILAGGFGTRLKEVIHDRPKVMAPINGKPFLEFVLDVLRKNGIEEIVISVGYLGSYIKNYFGNGEAFGLKIRYSDEHRPLGTGGAVKAAEELFKDPFFVLNGDTLLDTNYKKIWEFHQKKKSKATMVLVKRRETSESGFVNQKQNGRIISFVEKPKAKKEGLVNSGTYIFSPGITRSIKNKKRFSLEKDLFPKLAQSGDLYGFKISGDFIDIGSPANYQEVQKVLSKKKCKVIEVDVPSRISFAGGGTDLSEYFFKHGGSVLGTTINKYVHLKLKTWESPKIRVKLPDFAKEETYLLGKILPYDGSIFDLYKAAINKFKPEVGCDITVWADFPAGSGLGSSSAVTIALICAFFALVGKRLENDSLARLAIELEREELKIPGGWQDQYLCAFGGLNYIEFRKDGKVKVAPLNLQKKRLKELEKNLFLCYLGGKRSERNQQMFLTQQIRNEGKMLKALQELNKITPKIQFALKKGKLREFGELLHESWLQKKNSSEKVTTRSIDKIYETAMNTGALGGKNLGAGGGGYFLFYIPINYKEKVINSIRAYGLKPESFNFVLKGPTVTSYEN